MSVAERSRSVSVVALLATAIVTGAIAGLVAATFLWLVDKGIEIVWTDLPGRVGVDPTGSWWLFAVPVVGGLLVGALQYAYGTYPKPLEEAIATWKGGGHIEVSDAPKTGTSALVALVSGGPVGFEAALAGVLGGVATWIGRRITSVGRLVRQAWGAERIDVLPNTVHKLPYLLAAVSGLVAYRAVPFEKVEMDFRFTDFDGGLGFGAAAAALVFGAVIVVPAAWVLSVATRAEGSTWHRRSPVVIAVAGGLVFALMAVPNDLVLFSGQQGIQLLPAESNGDLAYVAIMKWAALVVALLAGWRGGPIFPTYTSVAAIAVLVDEFVDVGPDIMIVGGIAAVSVVFLKGSVPMAFVLTLYPVQLSYASVILVGCVGGALGLAIARAARALPAAQSDEPAASEPSGGAVVDAP